MWTKPEIAAAKATMKTRKLRASIQASSISSAGLASIIMRTGSPALFITCFSPTIKVGVTAQANQFGARLPACFRLSWDNSVGDCVGCRICMCKWRIFSIRPSSASQTAKACCRPSLRAKPTSTICSAMSMEERPSSSTDRRALWTTNSVPTPTIINIVSAIIRFRRNRKLKASLGLNRYNIRKINNQPVYINSR